MSVRELYDPYSFNPQVIMNSGQVFRMYNDGNIYTIFSGDRVLEFEWDAHYEGLTLILDRFEVTSGELDAYWYDYLNLGLSYYDLNKRVLKLAEANDDRFLLDAMPAAPGMRILHQDLWETIVSFLISQNNNIPKIRKTIEILCERFGEQQEYTSADGSVKTFYSFPTPERLGAQSLDGLKDGTLLGYRAKYILDLTRDILAGNFQLESLYEMTAKAAYNKLLKVVGIGEKVASCICLYGLHNLDSYPIDTWIKKIIKQDYAHLTQRQYTAYIKQYSPYRGYVQQLQFYYKRSQ